MNGHAEAVIKCGEDFAWVDEQSLASAMAYEDAAVVTRVDAVAGFYHRAETRHHGVVVDVMLARTGGTGIRDEELGIRMGILRAYWRHLMMWTR